jgi:hypothetical protein
VSGNGSLRIDDLRLKRFLSSPVVFGQAIRTAAVGGRDRGRGWSP